MTVDPSIAKAYWAQVQGVTDSSGTGSNYAFPCSTSLPDFSFSVGGVTSIIPGSYFNGGLYIGTAPCKSDIIARVLTAETDLFANVCKQCALALFKAGRVEGAWHPLSLDPSLWSLTTPILLYLLHHTLEGKVMSKRYFLALFICTSTCPQAQLAIYVH